MKQTSLPAKLGGLFVILSCLWNVPPGAVARRAGGASDPPAIRVAPPAPVYTDEERHAELAARRARVAQEVGAKGVLVMLSAEPRLYTNDVDFEFRQENNLFYLTHLNQPDARLVLVPGNSALKEILFLPRRDPARETWDGFMYSPEDAYRLSGVAEIWDAAEFEPFVRALQNRQPYRPPQGAVLRRASGGAAVGEDFAQLFGAAAKNEAALYALVPQREAEGGEFGDHREWRQEQRFAEAWKKAAGGYTVRSAFPFFAEMRLRKSPSEVKFLQHAVDITGEALGRSMGVAGRAAWEYEIEAEVEYTYKRRNADQWGYPSIVGCGPNATTLHYESSQGRVGKGDLCLMDVGAEYGHYTADITRTFPVGGKFTKEQADIYRVVLDAQEAAMRAVRPGATRADVHRAAVEVIKDGLLRLGLITDRDSSQYQTWFMHSTTHWLGMNVHDIGGGQKLEPGMVFTVEPGVYVRGDALDYLPKSPQTEKFVAAVRPAFEKYKNIGVRIEDDVLVTPEGFRNLSANIPRTIPEIESFMARAAREVR